MLHLTTIDLEAGLDAIRSSPADEGRLEYIVRRPSVDERELLDEGILDTIEGLIGDTWRVRGSSRTPDGGPSPDAQVTVMNVRTASLVAAGLDRLPLAGDQLYVDLDLSLDNLPSGSLLQIGSAVIEISEHPHTGCHKFSARFGPEALKFVNSPTGRQLRLRGLNARVVNGGAVRVGDLARKLPLS